MDAITIPRSGGPEVLTWRRAGPGARRRARCSSTSPPAAVNRADLLQRQGHYPPPPGAPPYPGLECSGRIAALGDGVDRLAGRRRGVRAAGRRRVRREGRGPGRPAAARAGGRRLVERGRAARGRLHGLVERLHARPPAAGRDAARARRRLAASARWRSSSRRRSAPRVVVHGRLGREAASAAASSARTSLINYRERGLRRGGPGGDRRPRRRRDPRQHGREVPGPQHRRRSRPNGRLVVIGMQGGTKAELDLGALMAKRGAVHRDRRCGPGRRRRRRRSWRRSREHVWPLVEAGTVRPVVDRVAADGRRRRGAPRGRGRRAHRQGRCCADCPSDG